MDLGLKGRKAIVSGATKTIGAATASILAAEGCDIGICARDAAAVAAKVDELRGHGVNAVGRSVDVRDAEALKSWVTETASALGGIDIVVPNVSALATEVAESAWHTGFETDILATTRTIDAAMPYLEQSEAPSIVVIASTAALEIYAGPRPYGAIKAALIHYVAGLSTALAEKGIRANTVSPGCVYAPEGTWARIEREQPEFYQSMVARNPMGRMGKPEEIGRAVAFLASPAASFTTGANLVVDGAFTRRVQY